MNQLTGKNKTNAIAAGSALFVLAAACLLVWWRTFNCFFYADDFLCLDYLYRIFHGEPGLALTRLVSPWQDRNVQLFWRPLADVSLYIDYFFWAANSTGYHITNFLLNLAAVFMVFALSREFLQQDRWSYACALAAALFFNASPLHIEAVTWVCGRIDLICIAAFAIAFWLALRYCREGSRKRSFFWLSILFYILALLTKEIAAALPAVLLAYGVILQPRQFGRAWRLALSMVVSTLLYAIARVAVLGTLVGGYQGSFGYCLQRSLGLRALESGSFMQLFIPLNQDLWGPDSNVGLVLRGLYMAVGAFLVWRTFYCPWSLERLRLLFFLVVWMFICLAPSLPVFHISSTLVGGRLTYLATIPMAIMVVTALVPDAAATFRARQKMTALMSALLLVFATVASSYVTVKTLKLWTQAADTLVFMRKQIVSILKENPGKKLLVVNVPSELHGVHMFYEAQEVKVLTGPNFGEDVSDRLVFSEYFPSFAYGNTTRLRILLGDANCLPYVVDPRSGRLLPCPMDRPASGPVACDWEIFKIDDHTYDLRLVPWDSRYRLEFLQVTVSLTDEGSIDRTPYLFLSVRPESEDDKYLKQLNQPVSGIPDGKLHTYTFCLSTFKPWLYSLKPARLTLSVSDGYKCQFVGCSQVLGGCSPLVVADPSTIVQANDSFCRFRDKQAGDVIVLPRQPACTSMQIEISRPSYMFDFPGLYERFPQASEFALRDKTVAIQPDGTFKLHLSRADFPRPARYQIRACALDDAGNRKGYFSDPITLVIE